MSSSHITRDFANSFADEWISGWNAHDLPRILSHYEDDFQMASPRIVDIAGEPSGVLRGKASVGAYWEKALGLVPDLRFEKVAVFVAPAALLFITVTKRGAWSSRSSNLAQANGWSVRRRTTPDGVTVRVIPMRV